MKTIAYIFIILLGLFLTLSMLAYTFVIVIPRHQLNRINQINTDMADLVSRVRTDPPDAEALKSLMDSLNSTDPVERQSAAGWIGKIGPHAEPAVDLLIKILNGSDPYARRLAAKSLGEIGPPAHRAIPTLIQAVRQYPHADVGCFAAESLGKIADPDNSEVIAFLRQTAQSTDKLLKDSALRGLHTLEYRHSSTQPERSLEEINRREGINSEGVQRDRSHFISTNEK